MTSSIAIGWVRSLVDALPAMIVPLWASKRTQPIAIEDVID
jgi:hypothetical protein